MDKAERTNKDNEGRVRKDEHSLCKLTEVTDNPNIHVVLDKEHKITNHTETLRHQSTKLIKTLNGLKLTQITH